MENLISRFNDSALSFGAKAREMMTEPPQSYYLSEASS